MTGRFSYGGEYLTCPHCGKAKKYRNFFDAATGQPIADGECGSCFVCGFDVRPRDYFEEHPEYLNSTEGLPYTPAQKKQTSYIPPETISQHLFLPGLSGQANLTDYLLNMFDEELLANALNRYYVGHEQDNEGMLWPQIDTHYNVREIKAQWHDRHSGKRQGGYTYQYHKMLRMQGVLPAESEHDPCLFGQHLLRGADGNTIVCIVESEKTALIGSIIAPSFIWLATGSETNFQLVGKARSLLSACRAVVVYPDAGTQKKWAEQATQTGLKNIVVSNKFTAHPHNTDIADLLIYEWQAKGGKIAPVMKTQQSHRVVQPAETNEKRNPEIKIRKTPFFPEPYNYEWLQPWMWEEILAPRTA